MLNVTWSFIQVTGSTVNHLNRLTFGLQIHEFFLASSSRFREISFSLCKVVTQCYTYAGKMACGLWPDTCEAATRTLRGMDFFLSKKLCTLKLLQRGKGTVVVICKIEIKREQVEQLDT